jgi:hypothetical protein
MKRKLWFIPLVLVAVALLAWIVMLLWNWVMPGLFVGGAPIAHLDYGRAVGLLILCRILFGGFRGRHGGHGRGRDRWLRWQAMTPEEREQFRSTRMGRCRNPSKEPNND